MVITRDDHNHTWYFPLFFASHILISHSYMGGKFFIRIVINSLKIHECNYYMDGKNIEKYHLWLWSSLVKILDLSLVALQPFVINPIFSLLMTDDHNHTSRDIFTSHMLISHYFILRQYNKYMPCHFCFKSDLNYMLSSI